jgi:hypothetical protein
LAASRRLPLLHKPLYAPEVSGKLSPDSGQLCELRSSWNGIADPGRIQTAIHVHSPSLAGISDRRALGEYKRRIPWNKVDHDPLIRRVFSLQF